jgi:outer membrane biosynthesis protein TonB
MRRYRIGRAPANDIVLSDSTVSREHAELVELGDGRYGLTDLGSTFGTAVLRGNEWSPPGDEALAAEARVRLGEFESSIAELLREADKTTVPGKPPAPPPRTQPPPAARPSAPPQESAPPPRTVMPPPPPREPPSEPPRTAPPTEVPAPPPRPATAQPPPRTDAPTEVPDAVSASPPRVPPAEPAARPPPPAPRPAPAAAPRNAMGDEKRMLLLLGAGFGAFLFVGLVVLAVVLAVG